MGKPVDPFAEYRAAAIADYDKHRLLGISQGEPGSWKTSFWLDGPEPIGVLSFDRGLEGVLDRVLRDLSPGKKVYPQEFEWYPDRSDEAASIESAAEVWEEYQQHFKHFVKHCRTVLVDKENDLWQLARWSEGLTGNDAQMSYDPLNLKYRKLVNIAKSSNCNVGFIRGMKDKWGDVVKRSGQTGKGPTGERIGAGFKELTGLVHFELTHTGVGPDDVAITVGKVRGPGGYSIAGQTFEIGQWEHPFREFAQLVFPDSDPDEWI
jgi:hypothetical protein